MRGGGSERFLTILIRNLDKSLFVPILALVEKEGSLIDELPQDIEVIDLKAVKVRYSLVKLIRLIRERGPEVVFSTLPHLNFGIMMGRCAMPAGITFIARETNIPSINIKQSPFPYGFSLLYRWLYPKFDKIVCLCKDMQEDLLNNFELPKKNTVVINNPVDLKAIDEMAQRGRGELPKGVFNILAAGKLKYQKGFDLLLYSMARIKTKKVHLTIMGHGPKENDLKRLVKELDLDSIVTFAGFVKNPYTYMTQADLFVLSSRFEGFPNVLLEANACGIPVVAFDCPGGVREIIEDEINGLRVEAENVSSFAKAVEMAIDTEWKSDLIRTRIEKRFNVRKIVGEYENLFWKDN